MSNDFTALLSAWRGGSDQAREQLIGLAYPELRSIARRQLAGERGNHTLQPTALVNEAYLRLSGLEQVEWQGRSHFVAIAARVMRQVLVDHARRYNAAKRDGGERITLSAVDQIQNEDGIDLEALDGALDRLESLDAVKARVVELRYFGGLTIEETAEALDLSPATIKRHWQAARAWLFDALG